MRALRLPRIGVAGYREEATWTWRDGTQRCSRHRRSRRIPRLPMPSERRVDRLVYACSLAHTGMWDGYGRGG